MNLDIELFNVLLDKNRQKWHQNGGNANGIGNSNGSGQVGNKINSSIGNDKDGEIARLEDGLLKMILLQQQQQQLEKSKNSGMFPALDIRQGPGSSSSANGDNGSSVSIISNNNNNQQVGGKATHLFYRQQQQANNIVIDTSVGRRNLDNDEDTNSEERIPRRQSSSSSSSASYCTNGDAQEVQDHDFSTVGIPVSYTLKPEPVFLECPPASMRIKGKIYRVRNCIKRWDGKRFARCCEVKTCTKLAQGPTSFCKSHGGGTRCKADGCSKAARGGCNYCALHNPLEKADENRLNSKRVRDHGDDASEHSDDSENSMTNMNRNIEPTDDDGDSRPPRRKSSKANLLDQVHDAFSPQNQQLQPNKTHISPANSPIEALLANKPQIPYLSKHFEMPQTKTEIS